MLTVLSDTMEDLDMRSRSKISRKRSKKLFRKTANGTHKRNIGAGRTLRGGYRL